MDLLTCPYVFSEEDAVKMAKAGGDVLVAHMGLTTKGSIGASTALTLEESARRVQAIIDAATRVNPEMLVLCHGGPIAEPEDVQYIFHNTHGLAGFFGASSMERLPTERAITTETQRFKALSMA
jgi:predicted TIM-barrel enzyme